MSARRLMAGAALGIVLLAALSMPAAGARRAHHRSGAKSGLQAVIRRTAYGIPHIEARSYLGLGYGYGYAFAQDDLCTMAEDYVTVDAQRSRFFGPDGSYEMRGNGFTANNVNSDFFWQQVIDSHVIDKLLAQPPPKGPKSQMKDLVRGYVAGYNRYLADVGGSRGVPDPTCRGKSWVRPITVADAYRRFYQLVLLASSDVATDGIGSAQPPAGAGLSAKPMNALGAIRLGHAIAGGLDGGAIGSNAVAIGKAGTRDHKHGLLLGNPHFPWLGTERFYQAQLTIPGKLNVEGASLFGVPLVLIGHTQTMAWSHTVSTARRFTLYQLTLAPGLPTSYVYDGRVTPMTKRTMTVEERQPDGSLKPVSRTLWTTRFGPMLSSIIGVPLPWTAAEGFALDDANADNFRVFNHFFDTDHARSAPQELSILRHYQGIPWVNTIVADRQGHALYADIGAVPNLPDAEINRCDTAVGKITFQLGRLPTLDGSTSSCNWETDRDAIEPGLFGPSHMPYLFRSDYVTNSNDSYWLSNPHHPLTGFAQIIGDYNTARSLRTRIGLIMTQGRVDGSDRLGPPGFTRQDMQNMVFGDRQYGGELVRDDTVNMCNSFPGGMAPTSSGGPVSLGPACQDLARWDLHENLHSRASILFRLFWEEALSAEASPWSHQFDLNDPVHTPYGLATNNPQVRAALGDAIKELEAAHIPLDAAPGDVQFQPVPHGRPIPLHGGPGDPDGEFNAIYTNFTAGQGFGAPYTGSSYVQVVTWHRRACPDARTILTYSESTNPTSAHTSDQTQLFSRKRWVVERFCLRDVVRNTLSTTRIAKGRRTATTYAPSRNRRRPRFTG